MKIERVKLLLVADGYLEVQVTAGESPFDVTVDDAGVVDPGGLPPEAADAFREGWPRYLAAKAARSVTLSVATVRPMDDPSIGDDERLFLMPHGLLGIGEAREIDPEAAPPPLGWWPVPVLTPMPAEFEGWEA